MLYDQINGIECNSVTRNDELGRALQIHHDTMMGTVQDVLGQVDILQREGIKSTVEYRVTIVSYMLLA